jgi:hypothetical protein
MISLLEEVDLVVDLMEVKPMDALSVSTVEELAAQMVMASVAVAIAVSLQLLTLQLVEVALTQILVSLGLSRELTMAFLTEI